jgi:hypothetical protein
MIKKLIGNIVLVTSLVFCYGESHANALHRTYHNFVDDMALVKQCSFNTNACTKAQRAQAQSAIRRMIVGGLALSAALVGGGVAIHKHRQPRKLLVNEYVKTFSGFKNEDVQTIGPLYGTLNIRPSLPHTEKFYRDLITLVHQEYPAVTSLTVEVEGEKAQYYKAIGVEK